MSSVLAPEAWSLWMNSLVFAAAVAAVWAAGVRLARYADRIRERTGLGEAVIGFLLLGLVTSLPEVAVAVSGAAAGNAPLVVNNMFGGLAMQVAILAIADAAIGPRALMVVAGSASVLLQGTFCILLLLIPTAGILTGDHLFLGVGLWCWALAAAYLAAARMIAGGRAAAAWRTRQVSPPGSPAPTAPHGTPETARAAAPNAGRPGYILGLQAASVALVILAGGFVLTQTGEAIAERTGLGSSFFGAVVLAIATSLPEVSTVLAAARLGRYEMAVSDIFGTNLLDAALVALVDAVYQGEAVLNEVGTFSAFAALMGSVVTALYMIGLLQRRDRTVARMGYDSIAVLLAYGAGVGALYAMR